MLHEFSEDTLRASFDAFLEMVFNGPSAAKNKTLANENMEFLKSKLATWPQIAKIHLGEIDRLQTRINALYLTLPKPENTPPPSSDTQHFTHQEPYTPDTLVKIPKTEYQVPYLYSTPKDHPVSRNKRFLPFIIGGIAAALVTATAGTAFGVVNRNDLEHLVTKVNELNARHDQIIKVLEDVNTDMNDIRHSTHDLVISSFMDRTFDSGIVIAKLRTQLQAIADQVSRMEDAIQQAQHHRLAVNYLSAKQLQKLFQQIQRQAKRFGYQTVVERPSELFQLDASYAFDGKVISVLLHIPIAPPDAFMRLYRLHPFPLPFDNGTLLTHNVKTEILAISNSNHRFTIQMSTVDLLGCHRLGRLYLCERNGLLNKYPEDTCLGSLYHQKFELAHQLCDFRVEPAREFIYQLLNNWFMIYEPNPLTIPVVCTNGTHSELHVRKGISKFHLTAGCIAEFPRYKLLSDISILIPQDYIQLEMDWDPASFLPGIRDYLIPEIQKLGKMGATMTSLATLQSMVASRLEDTSSLFHYIHFGFNSITIGILMGVLVILLYRCYTVYQTRQAQATARQVDLAVRTALNRTSSQNQLNQALHDGDLSLDQFSEVDVTLRRPNTPSVRYGRNSMVRLPPSGTADPYGDPFLNEDPKLYPPPPPSLRL
jgi:hypothetical protein